MGLLLHALASGAEAAAIWFAVIAGVGLTCDLIAWVSLRLCDWRLR